MKNILLLSSLLIFILSCTSTSNDNANQISKSNYTLQIIDSFIIEETSLLFDDYFNNKYVFHNHSSNYVVIYNLKTDLTTKFNNFGTNYDNYNKLRNNISFLNDTTICIGQIKKIKLYNTTGKYIKEIKYESKESTYATLRHIKQLNDSVIIIQDPLQGDNSKPEFYQQEHKLYAKWNINNNTKKSFVDFPPANSIYFDKKYYYHFPFFYYSNIDKTNNIFYILSANEPSIYLYDLKKLTFIRKIELKLDYYKSLKYKFGYKQLEEDMYIDYYLNGYIIDFYMFNNYFLVYYVKPFTKEAIFDYKSTHKNFPFDDYPEQTTCLSFSENENKTSTDIIIPDNLGALIYAHSFDSLIFHKTENKYDNQKAQTTFYIVKLMENENK